MFQVQEWTHKLRKEGYQLDRQVRGKLLTGKLLIFYALRFNANNNIDI